MLFDNPLPYFQMNFLLAMTVLGYLPKLKRDLGLAFGAYFGAYFLYLILYQWTVSMSDLFFFSRYQTKCVIKFLVRPLMRHEL